MYIDDRVILKEADNRLICHISHIMLNNGISHTMVRSVDTDVIIILLGFMTRFQIDNSNVKVWCDFGTGEYRRSVAIHSLFEHLGGEVCLELLFSLIH